MKIFEKQKRIATVITAIFLVAAVTLMACSPKEKLETSKAKDAKAAGTQTTEKLPKLVDFKSPTCPPCRAMEPILEELGNEYSHAFELELVDVSLPENQDRARKKAIQYIPTQIFYDPEGEQIFRHTGYYSKQDILNKWKELGYEMSPE
ncbi:MAG: thioredoxin family protein [Candidatus Marinimicrobia bacterium]|nr:thioredoxin family protein [Candidatus Neomarinimicrobiota bacterium]